LAQKIAQEIADGNRSGGQGLRELLEQRRVRFVDYAGWRRIDAAELSRASPGRCREKFSSTEAMLSAALAGQIKP
jgi:ferredoxin--NADP+ reductase